MIVKPIFLQYISSTHVYTETFEISFLRDHCPLSYFHGDASMLSLLTKHTAIHYNDTAQENCPAGQKTTLTELRPVADHTDPPQQPNISHKNQDYPFMAGQAATLYCSFDPENDRGNPPATLTWRGHAGSSGQDEVSLALTQLSSSDNGRKEVCEARNNFTDHKNTPVTRQTVIDVYCEYLDNSIAS